MFLVGDPCLQINNDLTRASKPIIKMSLELFHKVPAGAIETLFNCSCRYFGVGHTNTYRKAKNHHDIFINLDSAIEIAVRSKNPRQLL